MPPNKADPFFCDEADSGDAAMVVLVRVCETDNPVEAHGVGLIFRM